MVRAVLTGLFLLAVSFLVYRRVVSGYPPKPPGLALLHRGEAAFVDAAAEVLFPGGAGLAVSGLDADLPLYLDRQLAALPRTQRMQIRALFFAIEQIPIIVPGDEPGGRRRFSTLTSGSRVSILQKLATHDNAILSTLFQALRAVLVLGYLGHPANLQGLGLAPFEIDRTVSDAELLFPRIGGLVSSIPYGLEDRTTGASAPPLDPRGPRHRAYARASRESR